MLKSNKLGFAYSAFQFTPGLVHDKSMTLSSVKCKCEMPNFVQWNVWVRYPIQHNLWFQWDKQNIDEKGNNQTSGNTPS